MAPRRASPSATAPNATARFTITVPLVKASAATRRAAYISTATQSVIITLTSVGSTPYTGSPSSIASNLTTSNPNCSGSPLTCTLAAPAVTGSDTFSVVTYDAQQTSSSPASPAGNVLSQATLVVPVSANVANSVSTPLVLSGVPSSVTISGFPNAPAGTVVPATPFVVAVKDAANETIVGPYADVVTLADADISGATSIATSGSDNPGSEQLLSSSDVATLTYSGLAITGVSIAGSVGGTVIGTGVFAPQLNPIAPASLAGGVPLNTFNTPSIITFTASETGWTNAPYNQTLSSVFSGACSYIAAVAPPSGTTFTVVLISSPGTSGSGCTLTLSDGVGQSVAIPLGYQLFAYTNGAQNFAVPAGITQLTITADGAQGGSLGSGTFGGLGGAVTATIAVATPLESLGIYVGGQSTNQLGGFNDGGPGHADTGDGAGFGGGGSSDVREGGNAPSNRILVGGGGGGTGNVAGGFGGAGDGGTTSGIGGTVVNGRGGQPGTASAGGAGGISGLNNAAYNGLPGDVAIGGGGGGPPSGTAGSGGGGGSGYYGGGGGAAGTINGGGGGGGSGFAEPGATNVTDIAGAQSGNGQILITW